MTTIYRGVKVTLPSRTEKAPRSGVYRGVKWSRDEETEKEVPSMKRGTYRGGAMDIGPAHRRRAFRSRARVRGGGRHQRLPELVRRARHRADALGLQLHAAGVAPHEARHALVPAAVGDVVGARPLLGGEHRGAFAAARCSARRATSSAKHTTRVHSFFIHSSRFLTLPLTAVRLAPGGCMRSRDECFTRSARAV